MIESSTHEFPIAKIGFTVATRNGSRLIDSEKDLALGKSPAGH